VIKIPLKIIFFSIGERLTLPTFCEEFQLNPNKYKQDLLESEAKKTDFIFPQLQFNDKGNKIYFVIK